MNQRCVDHDYIDIHLIYIDIHWLHPALLRLSTMSAPRGKTSNLPRTQRRCQLNKAAQTFAKFTPAKSFTKVQTASQPSASFTVSLEQKAIRKMSTIYEKVREGMQRTEHEIYSSRISLYLLSVPTFVYICLQVRKSKSQKFSRCQGSMFNCSEL